MLIKKRLLSNVDLGCSYLREVTCNLGSSYLSGSDQ